MLSIYLSGVLNDLKESSDIEKSKYVLMERFMPETSDNYLIRPNWAPKEIPFKRSKITYELGIYGVIVR